MKIISISVLFIFLLIAVPILQSLLFAHNERGKFSVEHNIDAPYIHNQGKKYILLYFGYVGCTKVCTPTLNNIAQMYTSNAFKPYKPFVGVTFVNLMTDVSPEQPALFAQSFNSDFDGVYLNKKELMEIDRTFNLYFTKHFDHEMDHSDHLYLLQRQNNGGFILKNIYTTHPLEDKTLLLDMKKFLQEEK